MADPMIEAKDYNAEHGTTIAIRKIKYLNNIVEQDPRVVKRVTRPMLGFTSFDAAPGTLAGIELMHMLKKKQLVVETGDEALTAAEQFYALAYSSPCPAGCADLQASTHENLRQNPLRCHESPLIYAFVPL